MNAIFSVASLTILPLALTCAVLWYEKSRRGLRHKLSQVEKELCRTQASLRELRQEKREARRFDNAFGAAELSRRLRDVQMGGQANRKIMAPPPERYRYASSLIACGVEAGQLAEGLSLSRQEAEQLVALGRLAEKRGKNRVKKMAEAPTCH